MKTLKAYQVPETSVSEISFNQHLMAGSLPKSDEKVGDDYENLSREHGGLWDDGDDNY